MSKPISIRPNEEEQEFINSIQSKLKLTTPAMALRFIVRSHMKSVNKPEVESVNIDNKEKRCVQPKLVLANKIDKLKGREQHRHETVESTDQECTRCKHVHRIKPSGSVDRVCASSHTPTLSVEDRYNITPEYIEVVKECAKQKVTFKPSFQRYGG